MANAIPETMAAVLLTGHGGYDKLEYCTDVPVPTPGPTEVLIQISASAVNNTDINTRIGWYSKTIESGTNEGGADGFEEDVDDDGSWSGTPLSLPRIQGADAVGRIIQVGAEVSPDRIGERVIVRNMLRSYVDFRPYECWTFGSECDGGFAQFAVAPSRETYVVNSDWDDTQLAVIPCAFSTAENMLHRAKVQAGQKVLILGASGGVGLAAVQLAARRNAHVIAVAAPSKADVVKASGADEVIDRDAELTKLIAQRSLDVIIDVVAGEKVNAQLTLLRPGGKYAFAGAIGGPMLEIDIRTVYLNDLSILGCTFQEDEVFSNLIGYVERNEIKPVVSKVYPLKDIAKAQADFLTKKYPGKLVLVPPAVNE